MFEKDIVLTSLSSYLDLISRFFIQKSKNFIPGMINKEASIAQTHDFNCDIKA